MDADKERSEMIALSVGEDGLISESVPLTSILKCLPIEVGGLKKHTVVHSCLHATQHYLGLGSEQGHVWVVDLRLNKLLREFSDLKGATVTAMRLNPAQDHIAYGTTQGLLRVESITKPMAKRYTIREKDDQPLSALAWSQDGCHLYSGYTSGRLLKFRFQFKSGAMEAIPLLECGSQVFQLSVRGTHLLISTLARCLLMDTESGRLTQVGTKERRPGVFGASFSISGDKAYLTRPGLRVWRVDEGGKVLQTAKFRDIFLTSKHLPRIVVQSWPMLAAKFSETWQFSLVYAWLDRYIVTLHDKALWVLDPEMLTVVGILCLENKITAVVPNGEDLFVLCAGVATPLIKLSFSPRVSNTSIFNPEAVALLLSEQMTSLGGEEKSGRRERGMAGIGSGSESVALERSFHGTQEKDAQEGEGEGEGQEEEEERVEMTETDFGGGSVAVETVGEGSEVVGGERRHETTRDIDEDTATTYGSEAQIVIPFTEPNSHSVEPHSGSTTPPEPLMDRVKEELKDMKVLLMPAFTKLSGFLPHHRHPKKDEQENIESPQLVKKVDDDEKEGEVKEKEEEKGEPSGKPTSAAATPVELREPGKSLDLKDLLKLGKLSSLGRGAVVGGESTSPSLSPKIVRHAEADILGSPSASLIRSVPQLGSQEQERRLRMARAMKDGDDDIVVGGKTHGAHKKKKKKKRQMKGTSMSSRSSSASASMERLDDISESIDGGSPELSTITPTLTTPTKVAMPGGESVTVAEHPSELLEGGRPIGTQEKEERGVDVMGGSPSNRAYPHNLDQWLDESREALHGTEPTGDVPLVLEDESKSPTEEAGKSSKKTSTLLEHDRVRTSPKKASPKRDMIPQQPLFDDEEDEEYELLTMATVPSQPLSPMSQGAMQLWETTPPHSPSDVTLVNDQQQWSGKQLTGQEQQAPPPVAANAPSHLRSRVDTKRKRTVESSSSANVTGAFVESIDDPLYQDDEYEETSVKREHGRGRPVRVTVEPPSDSSGSHNFGASSNIQLSVERMPSEGPSGVSSDAALLELSGSGDWSSSVEAVPSYRLTGRRNVAASHPLAMDSDSSREDEGECSLENSIMAPDFYKLCGTLVQDSNVQQRRPTQSRTRAPPNSIATGGLSDSTQTARRNSLDQGSASDIWVPIPHPSRHTLHSVCLSDQLLWVIDGQGTVFYTTTDSKGKDWQRMKRPFQEIASSPSGNVVWALYQQNAYVRLGVGLSPASSVWKNTTRSTPLAKLIKQIAVDEKGVWVVKTDGQVLFRKDVSESNPEGKVWKEVGHAAGFSFVACRDGIVWVLTTSGKVFIREGITISLPSGARWTEVKAPSLSVVSITSNGAVWGLSHQESSLGFRCGVTKGKPMGKGPWWEVSLSALTHPSSPYNSLWQVMTSEGSQILAPLSSFSPLSTLGSLMHFPNQTKLVSVTASTKSGVCVLESGSKLHACWKSATGYHYSYACKDGVFQLTNWTKLAATGTSLWVVREDGELFCVTSEEKLVRIECESAVTLITASPSVLWVVTKNKIWSRQGMAAQSPEGYSWDYIELSTPLDDAKLRHIVCGNQAVWAIDGNGVPYFRFGVHSREPGTGMSPAWIPVDDNPHPFLQIAVSPDNWLVWACDDNFTVYVRTGVTQDYPVGLAWDAIPNEQIKVLCAACGTIYALTPTGELLCRHGITERNPQGNYWRRMPGKYASLATGANGKLWTLDEKGQVWRQESKVLPVSRQADVSQEDFEMSMVVDPSWEVV